MVKTLVRVVRSQSMKALLAAGLVAGASMISGASQAATIDLSTGVHVTGNIDNLWTVSPSTSSGQAAVVPNGAFPIPPWIADTGTSAWITPKELVGPPVGNGQPNSDYVYTTTFTADQYSVLLGKYSSDNYVTSISLNGNIITPPYVTDTQFQGWVNLSSNFAGDFLAGTNTLSFTVHNIAGLSGNPTGFRFEGGVQTGVIPEPSSLVLSAIGALMLGRLSWKKRLAHRDV